MTLGRGTLVGAHSGGSGTEFGNTVTSVNRHARDPEQPIPERRGGTLCALRTLPAAYWRDRFGRSADWWLVPDGALRAGSAPFASPQLRRTRSRGSRSARRAGVGHARGQRGDWREHALRNPYKPSARGLQIPGWEAPAPLTLRGSKSRELGGTPGPNLRDLTSPQLRGPKVPSRTETPNPLMLRPPKYLE
ncbi:hypothetical protein J1605_006960 [Eschrichtius robustus]|uniref:Uncharacterized protein n=1 Tax=Eschrichtius robustus TaxID=9764 RepID=A0AB34H5P7_ESCRO|nr:hypothetical protein J1605_006960 [Eschrichtius robustus]